MYLYVGSSILCSELLDVLNAIEYGKFPCLDKNSVYLKTIMHKVMHRVSLLQY